MLLQKIVFMPTDTYNLAESYVTFLQDCWRLLVFEVTISVCLQLCIKIRETKEEFRVNLDTDHTLIVVLFFNLPLYKNFLAKQGWILKTIFTVFCREHNFGTVLNPSDCSVWCHTILQWVPALILHCYLI